MQIIKESERVVDVSYDLYFERRKFQGSGFSFPSDEQGNVKRDELVEAGLDNLAKCRDGTHDVINRGVRRYENRYTLPAIGLCCGQELSLGGFTNTCPRCHADYNWSGQRLADRSQLGEETGEHLSDILMIP